MAKLKKYQDLEEKKKSFVESKTIKSKKELHNILEHLSSNNNKYYFRGIGEAKYKLYNSAQRFYLTKELKKTNLKYHDFIKSLIDYAKKWNTYTINNYFAQLNNSNNDFAYLSILQHYSNISPLLDFTKDPYYALYFSIDGLKITPSDDDIDYYFSLYLLPKLAFFIQSLKKTFADYLKKTGKKNLSYSDICQIEFIISIDNKYDKSFFINNNLNILNQKGLFILNTYEDLPLEKAIQELANRIKKKISSKLKFKDQIICYNIHKGLSVYLKNILERKLNINRKYMFPDLYSLREDMLKDLNIPD